MSRSPRSRLGTCVPGYAHSAVELHAGRDKKQVTDLRVVRGSTDDTPSDGDVGIIAGVLLPTEAVRPRGPQGAPGLPGEPWGDLRLVCTCSENCLKRGCQGVDTGKVIDRRVNKDRKTINERR